MGKQAVNLSIAKVFTICITLLTNMLLSRFRTLDEFGTYSQIMMLISLATSFLMFGLPNSVNYFLATSDTSNERKRFLSIYYSITTILGVLVGIVLIVTIPFSESYFNNYTINEFSFFILLYPLASITIAGISNVFVVYEKNVKLMLVNIASAAIAFFSVVIIQILGLSFKEYLWMFLTGNIVITLVIYYQVYKLENGLKFILEFEYIKRIFKYSLPLGIATLLGTISVEIDKFMIGGFMNTEALAIYSNAGKELPVTFIAASLTAVLLPRMAKLLKQNENEKAVELWGKTTLISFIIISIFSTLIIVFAPQAVTVLYSEKYMAGVQVFRIYALSLIFRITYFGMVLNAVGKTKYILRSSVLALVINSVLNFVLYKVIGFEGPALATLLSLAIPAFMQLLFTSRILNTSIKRIFLWKEMFFVLLVNLVIGILLYYGVNIIGLTTSVKDIILSIVIAVVVFILYIVFFFKRIKETWLYIEKI